MFELNIDGRVLEFEDEDPMLPCWEEIWDEDGVHVHGFQNPAMGMAVVYCKSPAGNYNQVVFYNRGGSVIVPTVEVEGKLYFLMLVQSRPLVGEEPIFEFPRGQAHEGENILSTAKRELLEETGLHLKETHVVYLGRGNPDSALFLGANVRAWWFILPPEYVVLGERGSPQLRSDIEVNPDSKLMESIRRAVFVPLEDLESPSMMTMWAAGLVLLERERQRAEH